MDKGVYDIKIYTDDDLLKILDLSEPTDAELEAKILSLISKYSQYNNVDGKNLKKFYEDIYHHFFYQDDQDQEPNSDIQEGFETKPPKKNKQGKEERLIEYTVPLDYSKDKLNPLLKQTTKRLIVIDSQYRDNRNNSSSTNFTFNLNDILKDVVNLKLYSFQIPYTWYVVNSDYGSNFFKLKGISSGINTGNYDISINIPVGNYNASGLIDALNTSINNLQSGQYYSDISFGNTNAIYNSTSCKTTLNFDIKNTFNENYYDISFQNWTSPYDTSINRMKSIPAFLGFENQNYNCNIIYSNRNTLLPSYQTVLSDNTIGAYYLDNTNNYFTIFQYASNTTPNISYTTTGSPNITILNHFKITLNLETQVTYTRTQLVNELNTQLQNSKYLINSGITRVNIGNNSHYEMKILLNRNNTVNNISNQKVAIVFPDDINIWTGKNSAFVFDNQINELSNITSENTSLATEFYLTKYPAIFLKCIKPFYGTYVNLDTTTNTQIKEYSTLNDYTIYINGLSLNGCSINEYINAINSSIVATNNSSISKYNNYLGDFKISDSYATIDASNNFQLNINLNKTFTQDGFMLTNIMFKIGTTLQPYITASLIPNTDLYTVLDLFHEYLNNGDQNLVLDLSKNTFTSVIPYSSSGFTFTVNRLFTIMPKTKSGLGTDYFPPFDINFNGSFTVPHTFYNITEMANYLTDQLKIYQFYDTKNNYTGALEQYNMLEGSYITCDFSGNNIVVELKIKFNSYITENDFELVFVDENIANVPQPPFDLFCRKVKPYFTCQNVTAQRTNNNLLSNTRYGYPFKYISMGVDNTTNCQLQYSNPETFTSWNPVIDLQNVMNTSITGSCYDFAGMSVTNFYFQHVNFLAVGGSSDTGGDSLVYSISNGLTTDANNWIGYNPSSFTLSTVFCVDTLFFYDTQEFFLIVCGIDKIKKANTIYYSNAITTDISSATFNLTSADSCFNSYLNSITTPVCHKWASNNYSSDYGNTGNVLVACGFSDTNTIGYSLDSGKTWNGVGFSLLSYAYDVAWNGNQFIACGTGTSRFKNLASSPDGQNWTIINFYCPIEQTINSISCNENTWVIGGTGTNTLAYSIDNGKTWTGLYNFTFTETVYSVQYFNVIYKDPENGIYDLDGIYYPNETKLNMWMAGGRGNNTVAYSNDGIHWNTNFTYSDIWDTEDQLNSWAYNLKIPQRVYDISYVRDPTNPYVTIGGSGQILDANILLNNTNNKIYLNPISIENGGNGLYTSDYTNSIVITIPPKIYTTTSLISTINQLFTTTLTSNGYNIANESAFSIVNINNQVYTQIRLNINKTYTAKDYQLIFYDPTITTLISSSNQQISVATWDSTLGWLLGYRAQVSYNLSNYITTANIATLTGDSVVSINLYNYFMIVLDDYNQNHLNDGLITTTKSENNVITPSYVNTATYNCNPLSNTQLVSLFSAPSNSTGDNTNFPQNLTNKQMYAAQEILNTQNNLNLGSPSYYFTNSPFAKDLFAILPLKIAGQQSNTVYVDYGGSLQNQERTYFGPVNISRMSIRLINDRGNVVDLNNSNWSFTLICEQLYQYKKT